MWWTALLNVCQHTFNVFPKADLRIWIWPNTACLGMSTVRLLNCVKDKDVILQYYGSCRQTVAAALWKHHSCNTLPSHHHLNIALPPFICLSVTICDIIAHGIQRTGRRGCNAVDTGRCLVGILTGPGTDLTEILDVNLIRALTLHSKFFLFPHELACHL